MVLLLRATFLKLVSIIDFPLERISQCESKDLVSVSAYYSEQIVNFVREVLAIAPKTVFDMLNDIVQLEAHTLKPLPMKVTSQIYVLHKFEGIIQVVNPSPFRVSLFSINVVAFSLNVFVI